MTAWNECRRAEEKSREDEKEGSQVEKQDLPRRNTVKNSPDTLDPSTKIELWG